MGVPRLLQPEDHYIFWGMTRSAILRAHGCASLEQEHACLPCPYIHTGVHAWVCNAEQPCLCPPPTPWCQVQVENTSLRENVKQMQQLQQELKSVQTEKVQLEAGQQSLEELRQIMAGLDEEKRRLEQDAQEADMLRVTATCGTLTLTSPCLLRPNLSVLN